MIEEKALEAAVLMSERYITDRHLPDKAIDVLDEACSKVSLKGYKVPGKFPKSGRSDQRPRETERG